MAEPTYHKATLLGLPTELRLQILEEAIAVRHAAPKSPSDIRNRRTRHYPHGSFLPARGNINVYARRRNISSGGFLATRTGLTSCYWASLA
ncbi:predicted protein [Chaetomium globosum CBS 148.51]|uniref:Uncharacterized protein n=1 Tax=Chaetomium globosum (strain ATCC 6205 / CBS 148.51 / DSM 1962 / NBRC 6347 / NRRL 1970) TaxID=306901 RepID=Q2H520_CHAGB|nr:uncharacterized protein CHGG_06245 [Chaetomium globosum CBS 148.51]EAQ89626.1 predicted protein [Chaetomium globosum CBS 148.51]